MINRVKNKLVSAILAIAVAAMLLAGALFALHAPAHAETEDTTEFTTTSLGLGNTNFSNTSGSYPAAPTSWSGAYLGGGSGSIVNGVIDLTAKNYFGTNSGNKQFKLDQYPEYAEEMPKTIFGENSKYANTDEKTLLINTAQNAETAYAYSSADMTFKPNCFYRVSAWVKTGDFAPDTGATIKLTGLGASCSFMNINTVRNIQKANGIPVLTKENNYGWVKYTFYVRTSASLTKTVKLSLGIGDALPEDEKEIPAKMPRKASGYAFFDTVEADQISAHNFANETEHFVYTDNTNVYYDESGTSMLLDLYEADYLKNGDDIIGTFQNGTTGWTLNVPYNENENPSYSGSAQCFVYASESRITNFESENNIYGFTQNPWAPLGRAEYYNIQNPLFGGDENNGNILLISTYNGTRFTNAAYGIASPEVTISRTGYYRFSVWVKTDGKDCSPAVSVIVKGKAEGASNFKTVTEASSLVGDSSDKAHYGWKEQAVYLKGSMLRDYTARFELWLGTPSSLSSGIAMFDNATFTELTYSEYSAMSSADGGKVYALDENTESTSVANGNFVDVDDHDELNFPLPAAEWTYYTAANVTTVGGFSTDSVNTDNAVYGIIPTDTQSFKQVSSSGAIPGIDNPAAWYGGLKRALVISSTTPTAYCLRSASITLSTDKANKLTVDMAVNRVTSGTGAALVLRNTDGNVLSTIEDIGSTVGFKTFTFYLAAPLSDQTVNLEIWLGKNGRTNKPHKLSNGNIYVREVALTEWSAPEGSTVADEYSAKLAEYKQKVADRNKLAALDFGVYSFSDISLDYYDAYSYIENEGLGVPYSWSTTSKNDSVIKGMFNADYMKDLTLYDGFSAEGIAGNMLYIFHTESNSTEYSLDNTLKLVSNNYYRIDVSVKVRTTPETLKNDDIVGATIQLTGATNAAFENIKDTALVEDQTTNYEAFKTYSFYISTGDNGGDLSITIKFGGSEHAGYIQGKLIVGGLSMTEIDNLDFEDAEKLSSDYVTTVKLSETNTDTDTTEVEASEGEIAWWVIPTVLFSAALIAVIVIIFVLRIRDRIKRNKKTVYTADYDRADAMRDIERLKAEQDAENNEDDMDDSYRRKSEHFDDAEEQQSVEPEQEEQPKEPPAKKVRAQKPAPTERDDSDLDD